MVQMIFNKNLDRILGIELVQRFTMTHRMRGCKCSCKDDCCFLLYRIPYIVAFWDAYIENYLEVVLVDLDAGLLLEGASALGCSLDLKLQSLELLRAREFSKHPLNDIFLSMNAEKMRYLHSHLEAIDKLLPLLEGKGGLISMRNGEFSKEFDFTESVKPAHAGLSERLIACISRSH
jgi:hypothetical protein